uniref:Uncharacterized protein n=1 Tax=viral metagenome TaxID=1070528 RepID=A0A6M3JMG9_9ZZZZ
MKDYKILEAVMTRGEKAGVQMADAIIEMVHLMYQNKTAIGFIMYLIGRLETELYDREKR